MSWPLVEIKNVARIVGGATPKSGVSEYWDGQIAWATPKDLADLDGKEIVDTPRKITDRGLQSCAAEQLPAGSVLFSSRAPIGHIAINCAPMATNQGFKSFVPGPDLDASFLYWWLDANREQLQAMGNGATFKEVSKAVVERIVLPLPPLPEQRRIAAILDQADALRRLRRQSLSRVSDLGRAIFFEMFSDKIRSGGNRLEIGGIATRVTKGESPKWQGHSYVESGALFVTSENVGWGKLLDKEDKFVPMEFHLGKLKRSQLKPGDLLINLVGASIGRACLFERAVPSANINQAVSVVTLKDGNILARYILSYLLSPWGQEQLLGSRVEGARANISLADVRSFSFYMPSSDEIERFNSALESNQKNMQAAEIALNKTQTLFASLQNSAFRGEL